MNENMHIYGYFLSLVITWSTIESQALLLKLGGCMYMCGVDALYLYVETVVRPCL